MQVTMTVNGEDVTGDDRAASPARALPPRPPRPHGHPLGLRHVQLRGVRGVDGRRAGEELHGAGRHGRRPGHPHRRGPRARRRARPGAAGLHGGARPAVRVLHPGHDAHGPLAARPQPRSRPRPRSARRSPARSAAAPATRTSSGPSAGRPSTRPTRGGDRLMTTVETRRQPHRLRPHEAQGGRPLHPGPGQLRRRPAAARACCTAPSCAARYAHARIMSIDTSRGRGPPQGQGRHHRQGPRDPRPGLDARRCRTTCSPCSPPTRSASRARRWPSWWPRTATRPATPSS